MKYLSRSVSKNGLIFQVLKNAIFRPQIQAVFSGPDFLGRFLGGPKNRPFFQDHHILTAPANPQKWRTSILAISPYIQKPIYFKKPHFSNMLKNGYIKNNYFFKKYAIFINVCFLHICDFCNILEKEAKTVKL